MNWRDEPITEKQEMLIGYIRAVAEGGAPFLGQTRGEAADYIAENKNFVEACWWERQKAIDGL